MNHACYDFVTYDVFTDQPFGGNPLAIFPQAHGLDVATMQAIAAELNLSETVFITHPEGDAAAHLRIFTPKVELPFAGHPTVGAAIHLTSVRGQPEGELQMRTVAGPVRAQVTRDAGDRVRASVVAPQPPASAPAADSAAVAAAIGLDVAELAHRPSAWSAGTPFTFAPLVSRQALSRATLVSAEWERSLRDIGVTSILLFTMQDWQGSEVHARMFGPGVGIAEDPATGSAAAALSGLLCELQRPGDGLSRWTVRQGEDMGRPSTIEVEARIAGKVVQQASIGGTAVKRSEGRFFL